jgi:hypothetical protein
MRRSQQISGIIPALATFALVACAPQSAVLKNGSYAAFLSDDTSLSLAKEVVKVDKYPWTFNIDCREFDDAKNKEETDALRLPDYLDICGKGWPQSDRRQDDEGKKDHPDHEQWITQGAYQVVGENLEPWRGEAVITAEGDFQIGFHHHLPGKGDFRFAFVVDPDFQPTECVQDGNKTVEEDVDGPWIENWSTEYSAFLDGLDDDQLTAYAHTVNYADGQMFFLNARSYQIDPRSTDAFWSLPEEWEAGFAAGKFAEEAFHSRATRYGEPYVFNFADLDLGFVTEARDLWFCDSGGEEDVTTSGCLAQGDGFTSHEDIVDNAYKVVDQISKEMARINPEEVEVLDYRPVPHTNAWRPTDGVPVGIDGWVTLHPSFVVFSKDSNLEEGGSAKGAFTLMLDGDDSQSRFVIKGEFEVEKIKRDRWVTEDLRATKLEENGTKLCVSK